MVQWDLLFIKYIQDMRIQGINILPIRLNNNILSQQSYSSTNTLRVCITSPVKRYTDAREKWSGTWQMCTGTKTLCDCVCPSHNTLFPGLTQENMGELWSRCRSVLVCAWADTTLSLNIGPVYYVIWDRRGLCDDTQSSANWEQGCISHCFCA